MRAFPVRRFRLALALALLSRLLHSLTGLWPWAHFFTRSVGLCWRGHNSWPNRFRMIFRRRIRRAMYQTAAFRGSEQKGDDPKYACDQ